MSLKEIRPTTVRCWTEREPIFVTATDIHLPNAPFKTDPPTIATLSTSEACNPIPGNIVSNNPINIEQKKSTEEEDKRMSPVETDNTYKQETPTLNWEHSSKDWSVATKISDWVRMLLSYHTTIWAKEIWEGSRNRISESDSWKQRSTTITENLSSSKRQEKSLAPAWATFSQSTKRSTKLCKGLSTEIESY